MRKVVGAIASAALVVVGFTACSSVEDSCIVESGQTSEMISVSGQLGQVPEVDFPTPLIAEQTQRSTIVDGSGPALAEGQRVTLEMSLYNGRTGQLLTQSGYAEDTGVSITLNNRALTGLREGLQCVDVGSRVALAISAADAFGSQGGNPALGIKADDTLVVVADVLSADLLKANGAPQVMPNGFPHVVLAPEGQPGVTVPDHAPPTELTVETRLAGDGPVVNRGDVVTVHYTGVLWKDETVFDSSWKRQAPATFIAEDGSEVAATSQISGIIPGLADALVGSHVGSQIVAVIPPELAYGENGQGSIPGGATLIFVVDVLGVAPAN